VFTEAVTLRGVEGKIVWHYHTAAECRAWTISRPATTLGGQWTLEADLVRADAFQMQQRPLRFTAPRKGGFFCFPILGVTVGSARLAATLGPPES
jgi:hypothetical protein